LLWEAFSIYESFTFKFGRTKIYYCLGLLFGELHEAYIAEGRILRLRKWWRPGMKLLVTVAVTETMAGRLGRSMNIPLDVKAISPAVIYELFLPFDPNDPVGQTLRTKCRITNKLRPFNV